MAESDVIRQAAGLGPERAHVVEGDGGQGQRQHQALVPPDHVPGRPHPPLHWSNMGWTMAYLCWDLIACGLLACDWLTHSWHDCDWLDRAWLDPGGLLFVVAGQGYITWYGHIAVQLEHVAATAVEIAFPRLSILLADTAGHLIVF